MQTWPCFGEDCGKILELWSRNAIECSKIVKLLCGSLEEIRHHKQDLMVQEDSVEGNLNYGGQDQEVSEGKNFSKWPISHSCGILTRNIATFCPCLKSLPENK